MNLTPNRSWNVLCWNVRGLNAVRKWDSIKNKVLNTNCLHQNLEEESQGLESSQDHVIKESIACRSEPADSDAKTGIGFLWIAPADNDKGYVRRQDETCWTLQKGKN